MIRPRLRLIGVALFIFLLCIIIVLNSPGRRNQFDAHPSPLTHASAKVTVTPPEKLAYATYLASTIEIPPPDDRDRFFVATRMLVYQILHDPKTRTQISIPILILVDPGVSQSKRDRLEKDGAIVIPVDYVRPDTDWLKPHKPRWRDMMVKLRLWELEEYSRILFIDSDTVLNRPFDGIFDEEGAQLRFTLLNTNGAPDEAVTATKYAMAGVLEVPRNHSYPPERNQYLSLSIFNGGFFVCAPSRILFHHYISVLNIPNRFDSDLMEMALLNYAHRDEGPMPWARLPNTWNIRNPNKGDVVGGVASVHEKWWKADEFKLDSLLGDLFSEVRWKMQGFYVGRERTGIEESLW
jgi:alpha-N-acetylglucosamine transferase